MPYDGLVLAAVCRELEAKLAGSRIQRVQQPEKLTLVLQFRTPGMTYHLLLSAHPQQARVHLTGERLENPLSPPLFCSVCRKHLEGGRVEAFIQPGFERVLQLAVLSRDELGRESKKLLIAEIMGRHSNLVLVDAESGLILDAAKRYTHAVSRYREVLPGKPYLAPPREKASPPGLAAEEFGQLLLEMPVHLPVWEALQRRFEGLSPLMAREVVHRSGLDTELTLDFCGEHELVALWEACTRLFTRAGQGLFEPTVLLGPGGAAVDFAAFSIGHRASRTENEGMNALVDRVSRVRAGGERVKGLREGLFGAVSRARKRLEKRLEGCHETAADGAKAEELRLLGEVLTANLYRLDGNAERVILEDFYTGRPVEITLDPRLSPAQNAQAYFKRYSKLRKGAERARAELAELEAEAAYLDALETAIALAETPADLEEVREELAGAGYLRDKAGARRPRKAAEPRPLELQTADGAVVYVGRNNRQNDLVTFKIGRPDDIWLHTKNIPGAHVIIRTGGRPVSDRTLLEAASWAAYFSKARQGKKVPVDYTLRKHVQKPKGARPGFVIYTHEKTVLVDPRPVCLPGQEESGGR
ncbi:Rqc2 family fibronectin-binding protein [Candidatus Desulforudis audaxviator]|uniref:Rqc2 homolog RqcH n=1 Tax=Desulforudis audaxviator (strain MP104C) TaxID=477974 RepID=B1I4N9_DESAP|nr:NFACT RNA binding domain-containing protein [Candidatus Desulforudis audaxviator]ACA59808.1 Fibronectin-binding A domain protein [Candidatus Desulforudis audaxviator MP104C]AZK59811.1 Fibronectin/fibrinogen-binding protein [Candidatus Desulforudis audaxviator]